MNELKRTNQSQDNEVAGPGGSKLACVALIKPRRPQMQNRRVDHHWPLVLKCRWDDNNVPPDVVSLPGVNILQCCRIVPTVHPRSRSAGRSLTMRRRLSK